MQIRELYCPGESLAHRLTPTTKLIAALGFLSLNFVFPWKWTAGVLIPVLSLIAYRAGVWRSFFNIVFKAALPYLSMLLVMQSLFYPGKDATTLFSFWIFSVKMEGVAYAAVTSLRILAMVSVFVLVQLVTHPATMMADLERRGFSSKLTYVVIATLNILPFLMSKADSILDAQRSRGLETEGRFCTRAKALLSLIGPLVVGTVNDVQDRAVALELRGFSRTNPRTFLQQVVEVNGEKAVRIAAWSMILLGLAGRVVAWLV